MSAILPPSLRERLRSTSGSDLPSPRDGKDFVLYVLRTAFRAASNPSLEVALRMASALGLPLVCVAVVEDGVTPGRSWRPTDRAAAFRLEALRELQPLFAARGTVLLVQVERDGCRAAVTMSLAFKAALVVTDEHFGIEPHATATRRLAQAAHNALWLCDCACTLPSRLLGSAALVGGNAGFLRATQKERTLRLTDAEWDFPPQAPPPPRGPPPAAAFAWSVDLGEAGALEAVLAAPSRRDASVGRVRHTRGGPSAARARWGAYVEGGGLKSYASHRNNPLAAEHRGASRMSAYVNAGMICPVAMARDALAAKSDKFLSEFVGFRESAHLWCLLHPGGYAVATVAVPAWARGMLRHAAGGGGDAASPALADLESGHTGDPLWDDCQRSLVLAGELHNNLRMAWGKAIPAWHAALLGGAGGTAEARLQAALDLLIRLNDRFALDGGAPPSYGGLLWCLGWRDRPGPGGCPTSRPTSVMASKIKAGDLERRARQRSAAQIRFDVAPTPPTARALEGGVGAKRARPAEEDPEAGQASSGQASASHGGPVAIAPRGAMWHFLNRQSAAALPPRERGV